MAGKGLRFALPPGVPHFGCETAEYCALRGWRVPLGAGPASVGGVQNGGSLCALMQGTGGRGQGLTIHEVKIIWRASW